MAIKTFRAKTAAEALSQVKQELGRDAVILHTRTERSGGILGIGKHTVIEITATTQDNFSKAKPGANRAARRETPQQQRAVPQQTRKPSPTIERKPAPEPAVATASTTSNSTAERSNALLEALKDTPAAQTLNAQTLPKRQTTVATSPLRTSDSDDDILEDTLFKMIEAPARETSKPAPTPPKPAPKPAPKAPPPIDTAPSSELTDIRRMLGQVLQGQRGMHHAGMPEALSDLYLRLLDNDLSGDLADTIAGQTRDWLTPEELTDASTVNRTVHRLLMDAIPICKSPFPADGAATSQTVALVGPTGVGKTTTLAKLAATMKLRRGRSVGLITCDTYRIAAVDQLRTYASIIGVPVHVAMTPEDVVTAKHELADCEVVLVDTAGRSPRDAARLEELRDLLGSGAAL
ncbi:MAG: flagellar biosynthesis protein FlhF [Planctomycetota bacterium]